MLIVLCAAITARSPAQAPIPDAEIAALWQQLSQPTDANDSQVGRRRALKNIVRQAAKLIRETPEAPNRFEVLGLILQSQKRLLAMENSERNRTALFTTCEKLAQAPDDYAKSRLEADLLLSEKQLSERNATLAERAEALAAMLERYRDTAAEAKSLLMAALIVQKLDARDLERAIHFALDERFSDDHEVIEFRREHLRISRLDVSFTGAFERLDGTELRFPSDALGHMCLMVFWSTHKHGYDAYLEKAEAQLEQFPGLIRVFSFNVDGLPDGGESILREHGLEWTVMRLPGGREHQAYRTYAQGDPVSVLVNEYGFAVIRPEIVHGRMAAVEEHRVSEDRYTAQLQSLFIGDFLVPKGVLGVPPMRDCFVAPPFRYRLTRKEALANYTKAAALCADAVKRLEADDAHPGGEKLRNARIVALLGMWSLACEPKYLTEALQEADTVLEEELPAEDAVVPRFCRARAALRNNPEAPESIVSGFLAECGGDDAPASALAAACVLALEAKSRELHEELRNRFLSQHSDNPDLFAFTAFLRDRHHRYRLLNANHTRRERGTRSYIVNHGREPMTDPLPRIELARLDGGRLILPDTTSDKITYLLFVEPPADPGADFPTNLDRRGKPTRNDLLRAVMDDAAMLTASHVNQGIQFIAAFLTDDADHVRFLVEKNGWDCQAALVPGGLRNPMVRQLGIYSADRLPNVFVIRRNGTIAWQTSGYKYKAEFGFPFALLLAMKVHVEVCEVEEGYRALEAGAYERAASVFAGPFPLARPDRFGWLSPRHHGRALALMGQGGWQAALDGIDMAIDAHKLRHFRGFGRRSKSLQDWRKDAARVTMKQPCDVIAGLWRTKVEILEQLGRKGDADELRERLKAPVLEEYPHVYKLFHERLAGLRESIVKKQ